MGKGDKKSRRGKIILGTFGVRRRRNKSGKPEASIVKNIKEKIADDIKPVKEKKVIKEEKTVKHRRNSSGKNRSERTKELSKKQRRKWLKKR